MQTKEKLEVGQDGQLQKTGKTEVSVDSFDGLSEIDYAPLNNWIILQPLPAKDKVTAGGIFIPGFVENKHEFRAAVVATTNDSPYKRGQVVRIDPRMWGPEGPPAEWICGKPLIECPEHFLKGLYTKFDLSAWKAEPKVEEDGQTQQTNA